MYYVKRDKIRIKGGYWLVGIISFEGIQNWNPYMDANSQSTIKTWTRDVWYTLIILLISTLYIYLINIISYYIWGIVKNLQNIFTKFRRYVKLLYRLLFSRPLSSKLNKYQSMVFLSDICQLLVLSKHGHYPKKKKKITTFLMALLVTIF